MLSQLPLPLCQLPSTSECKHFEERCYISVYLYVLLFWLVYLRPKTVILKWQLYIPLQRERVCGQVASGGRSSGSLTSPLAIPTTSHSMRSMWHLVTVPRVRRHCTIACTPPTLCPWSQSSSRHGCLNVTRRRTSFWRCSTRLATSPRRLRVRVRVRVATAWSPRLNPSNWVTGGCAVSTSSSCCHLSCSGTCSGGRGTGSGGWWPSAPPSSRDLGSSYALANSLYLTGYFIWLTKYYVHFKQPCVCVRACVCICMYVYNYMRVCSMFNCSLSSVTIFVTQPDTLFLSVICLFTCSLWCYYIIKFTYPLCCEVTYLLCAILTLNII